MKDVKFILFDEFGMIGLEMLGKIDHRLKQKQYLIKRNCALHNGNSIFLGDIFQLPPVMDTPLYSLVQLSNPLKIQGRIVWDMIDGCIILKNVNRQSDSMFGDVLNRISTGDILETDYNILKTRSNTNLTYEERKLFDDALNLYPTKDTVYKENLDYLTQLKSSNNQTVPICIINAKNNCKEAENASTDQAQSLEKTVLLGVSARVMLRYNAWTENSLVNGAMGTVVDIVYREGEKSPDNMPAVILITFKDYDGPFLHDDLKFPIHVAAAITFHKCQGLTLPKAKIDIDSEKEYFAGGSSVALSRVKSLDGLNLQPFSKSRLMKINKSFTLKLKKGFLEELKQKDLNHVEPGWIFEQFYKIPYVQCVWDVRNQSEEKEKTSQADLE
ncbi:ATP-dependent DNA helicase pif1-like [Frankliniella occidentalis]|uniref:ATP-dependent DNA helicase pif1-like n=1 Tax=Frankliniella occidentalis TaxID=133901 RepID=A0A9C6X1M7_FRAOC|nr:ATP-dependent DNA helicase pif1-like [Frankliniella occidentalis]